MSIGLSIPGKFIPQLVEYFLRKEFSTNDTILDPFVGSGTTLVAASEIGLRSVGVDISQFNCTIAGAKLLEYDLQKMELEVRSICNETEQFSNTLSTDLKLLNHLPTVFI